MRDPLELHRIRDALATRCASELAAERARNLEQAGSLAEAEARLDALDEARALDDRGLAAAIPSRLDFGDALALAVRGGMLDGADLRRIGVLLRAGAEVRDAAESWQAVAPGLSERAAAVPAHDDLAWTLIESFDEHDALRDDASPELARRRAEVRQLSATMRRRIGELVRDVDQQGALQDDYWTVRQDRFVLPVRASDRRHVAGIVHGSSQTGATVFVEPTELVEQNNRLALVAEAVRAEERRILSELSGRVGAIEPEVNAVVQTLIALDLVFAAATLCRTLGTSRPVFSGDATMDLRAARHPLLVLAAEGRPGVVVPNDIGTGNARWLVVSGPNGGGKTVTLTTVGVAAAMARMGLQICAGEGSRLPWADEVHVVLGDAQDLGRGLSTFAGHLERLRDVLAAARGGGRHLILLDELASGTEPAAGSALARAVLEALAETDTVGACTTHDEAVKMLAVQDPRFLNAALELDRQHGAPTYRLRVGAVGSSSPLALAARVGLPDDVLGRADALLGGAGVDAMALLEELEQTRQTLRSELRQQEHARRQLEEARQRLDAQRKHEKLAADKRIAAAAAEAIEAIEAIRATIQEQREQVERGAVPVEKASRRLAAEQRALRERCARDEPRAGDGQLRDDVDAEQLAPGDEVFHTGLARVVRIVEIDSRREEARVVAGALELRAPLAQLRTTRASEKAAEPRRRRRDEDGVHPIAAGPSAAATGIGGGALDESDDSVTFRSAENTIDLRGMRVDEALAAVDAFLDASVMAARRGVTVVHGLGTGALKRAVEQHLRRHPQVRKSRLAGAGEGSGGATLVWLAS
ncbi:MAG: Smr/MutS family protein [Deltaproteobacteria bacterium]|nr:Smr/MutS family protein [Deltaproteobacteria bacterium]